MVKLSQLKASLLSVATLAAIAAGCNSTPKLPSMASKTQAPAPASTTTANPGSLEFSSITKLQNPVKVHLAYAQWHEQERKLVEARDSYNRVLNDSPKNVEALLGLARLDIALGRMDDAEKHLIKAQKVAPKNAQVAISFGQYYSARNDWPRALEQMKTARTLSPYDPVVAYHLGQVQAMSGDMTSAVASFTEAVGPAEAQYNVAYVLHEQGNLVAAEEHLQRAISLKADLPQAQSLLLTVRQERYGNRNQMAQKPGLQEPARVIQPASYSEPAQTSTYSPAPAH